MAFSKSDLVVLDRLAGVGPYGGDLDPIRSASNAGYLAALESHQQAMNAAKRPFLYRLMKQLGFILRTWVVGPLKARPAAEQPQDIPLALIPPCFLLAGDSAPGAGQETAFRQPADTRFRCPTTRKSMRKDSKPRRGR